MRSLRLAAIFFSLCVAPVGLCRSQAPADKDHTLQAMKDEMARAKSRLELAIPPSNQPVRPYYVEYRLARYGYSRSRRANSALCVSTGHSRTRLMNVGARVGDYKLDSSNFIGDEGFPRIHRPFRQRRHRSRLRLAAAGSVDCHGPGLQGSRRNLFPQAGLSQQPRASLGHRRFLARSGDPARRSACSLLTGPIAIGSRKPVRLPPLCALSRKSTNRV